MRLLISTIAILAAVSIAQNTAAQTYPSKPITVVVPFVTGGPVDTIGRIMAERMKTFLGQPILIENVGGAAGSIGVGRAALRLPMATRSVSATGQRTWSTGQFIR